MNKIELATPRCPATEYAVRGKYGEIWEHAPGILKAYLYRSGRGQFRIFRSIETFKAEELPLWASRLKIYKTKTKMARFANSGVDELL